MVEIHITLFIRGQALGPGQHILQISLCPGCWFIVKVEPPPEGIPCTSRLRRLIQHRVDSRVDVDIVVVVILGACAHVAVVVIHQAGSLEILAAFFQHFLNSKILIQLPVSPRLILVRYIPYFADIQSIHKEPVVRFALDVPIEGSVLQLGFMGIIDVNGVSIAGLAGSQGIVDAVFPSPAVEDIGGGVPRGKPSSI